MYAKTMNEISLIINLELQKILSILSQTRIKNLKIT